MFYSKWNKLHWSVCLFSWNFARRKFTIFSIFFYNSLHAGDTIKTSSWRGFHAMTAFFVLVVFCFFFNQSIYMKLPWQMPPQRTGMAQTWMRKMTRMKTTKVGFILASYVARHAIFFQHYRVTSLKSVCVGGAGQLFSLEKAFIIPNTISDCKEVKYMKHFVSPAF